MADNIHFNRTFSNSRSGVDQVQCVSSAQPDAGDELYPEAFELSIEHVRNQAEIGQQIMLDIFSNATGFGADRNSLHYAMDLDEGTPPGSSLTSEAQIRQQLDQQSTEGGFTLDHAFQLSHEPHSVTTIITAKIILFKHHRVFAVVLDRPTFVTEAGVCFYMTMAIRTSRIPLIRNGQTLKSGVALNFAEGLMFYDNILDIVVNL
ncbi:hypothetical protein BDW59DRAFT_165597 [Aspergillus cavernicola]|uniref:Uncharacterized protein n=1 Tax=Aspergillus cavernicola TaxID=176166 RepID=A0ABR4HRN8_9EURO